MRDKTPECERVQNPEPWHIPEAFWEFWIADHFKCGECTADMTRCKVRRGILNARKGTNKRTT
jgi:hypothetical protein